MFGNYVYLLFIAVSSPFGDNLTLEGTYTDEQTCMTQTEVIITEAKRDNRYGGTSVVTLVCKQTNERSI